MQAGTPEVSPTVLYATIGGLWTVLQGVAVYLAHGSREAARETAKKIDDHGERITVLETVTGVTTDNGMKGELRGLRSWRHDEVIPKLSRIDLLDFRVAKLEEGK